MTSVAADLARAAATLASAGVASPLVDARLLAAHFLGCAPLELTFHSGELPEEFWQAVARRANREPLQHITGLAPFGPLELAVGPGVFIPRPETEALAQWALDALRGVEKPRVVDLCTGSGALAVMIAHARADAHVHAVEYSAAALPWAQQNIQRFAPRVQLLHGDARNAGILKHLPKGVDLVVSNPPYVPLGAEVDAETRHDPHDAVFGGVTGMDTITAMVPIIHALVRRGGLVGIEHDDATGELVRAAFAAHGGFVTVTQHRDLAGRDRFVTASKL
ncbi:peptide chain release factor N(5)-glutamine methyltransferase [Corynebacterium sp.]|uniref:peptide chain release factor N(5)-glutamine methyltransferase n=1 Tax=Corynebacterium sp. TaxID=1720 RepID=UPI0026DC02B1|nr:peptide chain release factor N(5)-glutamine methyltransferase [Corynebacterium sp.]MDO5076584.1 peptide chain release factor N(5)-glutamine methyltransferase [Corynebacterium sp.]